jgi:hypothetical protein
MQLTWDINRLLAEQILRERKLGPEIRTRTRNPRTETAPMLVPRTGTKRRRTGYFAAEKVIETASSPRKLITYRGSGAQRQGEQDGKGPHTISPGRLD